MVFTIQYSTVLVAALAAFVLGFLWHGPLFGKTWMKLMNISQAEADAMKAKGMGPMVPLMATAFVQQIVVAATLSILAMNLYVVDIAEMMMLVVLVWFGFIAMTLLNGVLWEKRTMNLYMFNIIYHLAILVTMGLVIVWMG